MKNIDWMIVLLAMVAFLSALLALGKVSYTKNSQKQQHKVPDTTLDALKGEEQ